MGNKLGTHGGERVLETAAPPVVAAINNSDSSSSCSMFREMPPKERDMTLGTLDVLPAEVIVHIFHQLPKRDLARSTLVSKMWRVYVCNIVLLTDGVFAGTKVTPEELLAAVTRIRGIKYLNLSVCPNLTKEGIQNVLSLCDRLEELVLYGNRSVGTEIYTSIQRHCPRLTSLDLTYCNLNEDRIVAIGSIPTLKVLNLSEWQNTRFWGRWALTSESLTTFITENSDDFCPISGSGPSDGPRFELNTPNLTRLSMAHSRPSDSWLYCTLESCPLLTHLDLSDCNSFHIHALCDHIAGMARPPPLVTWLIGRRTKTNTFGMSKHFLAALLNIASVHNGSLRVVELDEDQCQDLWSSRSARTEGPHPTKDRSEVVLDRKQSTILLLGHTCVKVRERKMLSAAVKISRGFV
eukprot:TRINITY_DN5331_c0_g1_i3.p1 TRINITY_DN5331_c0_g1~~TRINITY_DN5331_c0_g1_i3.p1  ORF type:complete len:408 (-),score=41.63 TRINITY_DN5331_c0_g1_i3:33-1256(-)